MARIELRAVSFDVTISLEHESYTGPTQVRPSPPSSEEPFQFQIPPLVQEGLSRLSAEDRKAALLELKGLVRQQVTRIAPEWLEDR